MSCSGSLEMSWPNLCTWCRAYNMRILRSSLAELACLPQTAKPAPGAQWQTTLNHSLRRRLIGAVERKSVCEDFEIMSAAKQTSARTVCCSLMTRKRNGFWWKWIRRRRTRKADSDVLEDNPRISVDQFQCVFARLKFAQGYGLQGRVAQHVGAPARQIDLGLLGTCSVQRDRIYIIDRQRIT
jgi:hypothetical protein